MWRIVGISRKTGKLEEVAVADNPAEKAMILREEIRNYRDLRAVGMSVPITGAQSRVGVGA